MKTKTKNIIIISLLFLLCSCSKESFEVYDSKPSLYFRLSTRDSNLDSLYFSFIITLDESYDINIPVQLLGKSYHEDKTYTIKVLESSTAVEGLHYESFSTTQTFPANQYGAKLIITLLNKDPQLEERSVNLDIAIDPNENFDLGDHKRLKTRVLITNLIMKPAAWESSSGILLFGPYSKVKHRIYVSLFGEFPNEEELSLNYNYYKFVQVPALKQYLLDNYPIYDENNQIIAYTW